MTVDELKTILENAISSLAENGFEKIDPGMPVKLNKLAALAGEAGMNEGKRLLENLAVSMKAILEGKSTAESAKVRLTALEFYLQNLSSGSNRI